MLCCAIAWIAIWLGIIMKWAYQQSIIIGSQMDQVDKYSFRQFLVPADLSKTTSSRVQNTILNPEILHAVADSSLPPADLSLAQRAILFYKSLNWVIRPENGYLLAWQFVLVSIILYYILELGLLLAFKEAFWQDELNHVAVFSIFIIILAADILISPLKAYYEEGLLILDVAVIFRKYMALEFWIDIIGLATIAIPLAIGKLEANWVKLFWLAKIYTASKINVQFQRVTQLYITLNTGYLVVKLVAFCYIYAHYMGIFFYMVSMWVYNNNYYGPNTPNLTWVYNSWAFYQMALILSWQQTYIYIMYYSIAVVTTIAYGDITPKNPIECIYTIFALIIVTLIFGYIMTEILRLMIAVFVYNFDRGFQHFELMSKLKNQNVQQDIQILIRAHTNEIDREEQYRNRKVEEQIMNFLPPDPLYGLLVVIYNEFLRELGFTFFSFDGLKMQPNHCRSLFLENIMKDIRQERHFTGDLLYCQGDTALINGHSAYYFTKNLYSSAVILGVGAKPLLKAGKLDVIRNQQRNSFQLSKATSIFGQIQFLNGQQRSHWAFCVSNCVLFSANRLSLLNHYHLLTQQEKQVLFTRMEGASESMCLVCQENHELFRCPYSFLNLHETLHMDRQVFRKSRILKESRTRLKTLSSWSVFKKIRDIRIRVSRQFREKLLLNKANHSLFIQYELEEDNKDHDQQQFQSKIRETEVMVERLYEQILLEIGKTSQGIQYDRVYVYRHYKPHNNITEIAKQMNQKIHRAAILNAAILKIVR